MKDLVKEILVRSVGLVAASFFGGTAIGALAGDWLMGSLIGVGAAFALVLTMLGVNLAWSGKLTLDDISNAFRAAVARVAENNDSVKDALEVTKDGKFDFDDLADDSDPALADENQGKF